MRGEADEKRAERGTVRDRPVGRRPGNVLLIAVTLLGAVWVAFAVWFQTDPPWRWLWLAVIAITAGGIFRNIGRRRIAALLQLIFAILVIGVWWDSITPSNDREWAGDVARGVRAEIIGSQAVLHDVRNFDWRSRQDYSPRWETRRYDIDKITSVDLVSSVWASPAIAHTMISFGFSNGDHVVFSAEIRREAHETFSEIGGFFRQFELVMIAADESDIVRLRTNIRREDVSLFPLRVSPEQARGLFLSYIEKGNQLADKPQFYQTVTTNCTTLIFKLAQLVEPGIPMDWRILLSGYLPDYLYDHDVIRRDLPMDRIRQKARISKRAQEAQDHSNYSEVIRAGVLH